MGIETSFSPIFQSTPKLLLRMVGLFNSQVGELLEMWYEFEEPFILDSTKFETAFRDIATPPT